MDGAVEVVHGTCVSLGGAAALLRGPSGAGKSDLALRFIFLARRGPAAVEPPLLVADDQVRLRREGPCLIATAPETIRGKMEVRGIGIVDLKSRPQAELRLVVDLVGETDPERMPEPASVRMLGIDLPFIRLAPREASAPIKLALALARAKTLVR